MATHTLGFIPVENFSATNGVMPDDSNGLTVGGTSWGAQPPDGTVISFDYSTISTIGIDTDYPEFTDDPYDPEWSGGSWTQHTQENATELTINGQTYAPGTLQIENEYEFSLMGSDGVLYQMVGISALSVNKAPGAWYPSGPSHGIIGFTFKGAWPPEGVVLTFVENLDGQEIPWDQFVPEDQIPCFVRGTLIETINGFVAVEDLVVGDMVITKDHGAQPVRWIGSKKISRLMMLLRETLRPIRIRAGALGVGVPANDLLVSPQHRILVNSQKVQKLFSMDEVLVPAKQLLQLDGIDIAEDTMETEYFHILFDQHEIVNSNGAQTESFYTGVQAIKAIGIEAREEIFALFPELRENEGSSTGARMMLSGRESRKLVARHLKAKRDLALQ